MNTSKTFPFITRFSCLLSKIDHRKFKLHSRTEKEMYEYDALRYVWIFASLLSMFWSKKFYNDLLWSFPGLRKIFWIRNKENRQMKSRQCILHLFIQYHSHLKRFPLIMLYFSYCTYPSVSSNAVLFQLILFHFQNEWK